jgi:glycerol-3-phosphate O-acyltransferase/dihydroxyacetone phosphate acyltransferase
MFPDFESTRLVHVDHTRTVSGESAPPLSPTRIAHKRQDSGMSSPGGYVDGLESPPHGVPRRGTTLSSRAIPRNESFSNIGEVQIFATRPSSRSRSRSSSSGGGFGSAGFPIAKFTTLDSKEGFDEASKKIREAMRERGELRRRKSQVSRNGFLEADETDEEDEAYDNARNNDT